MSRHPLATTALSALLAAASFALGWHARHFGTLLLLWPPLVLLAARFFGYTAVSALLSGSPSREELAALLARADLRAARLFSFLPVVVLYTGPLRVFVPGWVPFLVYTAAMLLLLAAFRRRINRGFAALLARSRGVGWFLSVSLLASGYNAWLLALVLKRTLPFVPGSLTRDAILLSIAVILGFLLFRAQLRRMNRLARGMKPGAAIDELLAGGGGGAGRRLPA